MKKVLCLALAAIMLLGLVACADNGDQLNASGETPVIRWIASDPGQVGRDEVEAEIVRYVKEKINVQLDIVWLPAENDSILGTTIVADEWDVASIGGDLFNSNVGRHAFLPLDDYLEAYMPNVKDYVSEECLVACSWKGEIYGLSAYKDFSESWGLLCNQDLMDEFNITIPEDYNTEMDLVPLYYEATKAYRAANPNSKNCVVKIGTWLNSWFQYDNVVGGRSQPLAVTNIVGADGFGDTDPYTVFSPYFTEDYAEYVRTVWQMAQDDIIPSAHGDGDMKWTSGEGFFQPSSGWLEVDENQFSTVWKCSWYPAKTSVMCTGTLQTHINVVSSECENPEAALKFLDLTYSDTYLCTTLKFGIQGRDWEDADDDGVVELLDRNADSGNRFWYDWYGTRNSSLLNSKIAEGFSPDFHQNLEDLNASGLLSEHVGFNFDVSPVANEIAACTNVLTQYVGQLQFPGFKDPDTFLETFRKALKDNGIDKIVAEAQSQLDAWHAAQ